MHVNIDAARLADELTPHLAHRLLKASLDTYDYDRLAAFAASLESAGCAVEHLQSAQRYRSDEALLRAAVGQARRTGLFLEFGVASGRTLRMIAAEHAGKVFGLDSFGGLPEGWRLPRKTR